ncbi:hypothetical protein B0I35DRAFT_444459 [Stachybotrys elegans]|uniref:Uncharacterized protein n=1 Tax=Stachybotrys elegans TaxID=80388 RepID=A0A8K0SID4_9HYPO|nr:hypothetical protein B0I35DRAFT_444459 [Stachybotrys elegans]
MEPNKKSPPRRLAPKCIRRPLAERQQLALDEEQKLQPRKQWLEESCREGNHNGHVRDSCPYLPCSYCRRDGHLLAQCRKFQRKRNRQNKQQSQVSPSLSSSRPLGSRPQLPNHTFKVSSQQSSVGSGSQRRKYQPLTRLIRPSYPCPGMRLDDPEAKGTQDSKSIFPTPEIIFLDLGNSIFNLVIALLQDKVEEIRFLGYSDKIKENGPIDSIIHDAMNYIEPEVIELQGINITPEIFQNAQKKQFARSNDWPDSGGYVDGVTDLRHNRYIRFYVGQSHRLPIRISIEHAKRIRNSSTNSLHCFTLARGMGHRCANFLRLWSIPDGSFLPEAVGQMGDVPDRIILIQNILEMTFCYAFRSLPGVVLEPYFGPSEYTNIGLNTLPPLFNGPDIPAIMRASYLEHHRGSPDPDISVFVDIRKQQKLKLRKRQKQSWTLLRREYRVLIEALARQLGLDSSSLSDLTVPYHPERTFNFGSELQSTVADFQDGPQHLTMEKPLGNLEARIGIVLSVEMIGVKYDGNVIEPFKGLQLTEENSMTWTSSLQKAWHGFSRLDLSSAQQRFVDKLNQAIILGSGTRVIALCGLTAQNDIIRAMGSQLRGPFPISFPSHDQHIWVLVSGQKIIKILITCPEPMLVSLHRSPFQIRQLTDVFGLASTVTDVDIRYTHWEKMCFQAAICAQVAREKKGAGPLRAADLPVVFRNWLRYRGFALDADVEELERLAGNLTLGIQQIRSIVASHLLNRAGFHDKHYQGYRGNHDPDRFRRVYELFHRLHGKHISSIDTIYQLSASSKAGQKQEQGPIRREGAAKASKSSRLDVGGKDLETKENQVKSYGTNLPGGNSSRSRVLEDRDKDKNDITDDFREEEANEADSSIVQMINDIEEHDGVHIDTDDEDDVDITADFRQSSRPFHYDRCATGRSKKTLELLLSESGLTVMGTRSGHLTGARVDLFKRLIRFTVSFDPDILFNKKPRFDVRVRLVPPGEVHPYLFLGTTEMSYMRSDPCLRLGVQYRPRYGDSKKPSESWIWAESHKLRISAEEKIFRANTLVDLLEGKRVEDLVNVPRRSLEMWNLGKAWARAHLKELATRIRVKRALAKQMAVRPGRGGRRGKVRTTYRVKKTIYKRMGTRGAYGRKNARRGKPARKCPEKARVYRQMFKEGKGKQEEGREL